MYLREAGNTRPALFFLYFLEVIKNHHFAQLGQGQDREAESHASLSDDLCVEKVRLCELDILTHQAYLISIFISAGSLPIV